MSRGLSVMDWQDIWVFLKIQVKLYKSVQTYENIILFFWRKMKDVLSQKYTWKYDIFFKCLWKDCLSKKSHWNMIFLVVLFGKMIFFPPEYMILFFRGKMKDDLSQKNTWKYDVSSNALKRWPFQKKIALKYDLSCIIWKGGIFYRKI